MKCLHCKKHCLAWKVPCCLPVYLYTLSDILLYFCCVFFVLNVLVFRWGTHLYMSLFPSVCLYVCLSSTMSQELYIIWSYFWYTYIKCSFFIFLKFSFFGLLGGKRAKIGPKWEKILSVALHILRTIHHMIFIYGAHVENDNISRHFFYIFKILIFRVVRG